MKFDVMLTGVGGEGVLTSGVIIAKAAHIEGHYVRGVQLHGLAQRGGTIPTFVRFGSKNKISSPGIMQANANLILSFEPLEAVRAAYYARKNKTVFVINDYPLIPVHANIFDIPYPDTNEIIKKINPFAKKIFVFKAHDYAEQEFGNTIFGNTILLGAVVGAGLIPLKEKSLREAIKASVPKKIETNLKAFEVGLGITKN